MNRVILAGAAVILTAGSALAADLAVKAAPPPPPPPLWAGPFVGVGIGFVTGNTSNDVSGKDLFCAGGTAVCSTSTSQQYFFAPTNNSNNKGSFAGGLQFGYNYEFDPRFVLGGVVDFTAFDRSSDTSFTSPPVPVGTNTTETRSFTESIKNDWLVTLRLRGGPTFDRLWIYGTGGLALADLRSSSSSVTTWTNPLAPPPQIAASGSGSTSGVALGYVVGAGAEYKISPEWSIFGEYLYYSVRRSYSVVVSPNTALTGITGSASYGVDAKVNGSLVKIGLNYAFRAH